jgi:hypothetical protein
MGPFLLVLELVRTRIRRSPPVEAKGYDIELYSEHQRNAQ